MSVVLKQRRKKRAATKSVQRALPARAASFRGSLDPQRQEQLLDDQLHRNLFARALQLHLERHRIYQRGGQFREIPISEPYRPREGDLVLNRLPLELAADLFYNYLHQ